MAASIPQGSPFPVPRAWQDPKFSSMSELDQRVDELATHVASYSAKVDDVGRQTHELKAVFAQAKAESARLAEGVTQLRADRIRDNEFMAATTAQTEAAIARNEASTAELSRGVRELQAEIEHDARRLEQIERNNALAEEESNRFWNLVAAAIATIAAAVFAIGIAIIIILVESNERKYQQQPNHLLP
jgi:uncharacterized coiled-coil DUF342 family protein